MRLFDLIRVLAPHVDPERTKVHLATWNGIDDPLDLFREGRFESWQADQTQRNFERAFVVTLIAMGEANQWLYGGAYTAHGATEGQRDGRKIFDYDLRDVPECAELKGRAVVRFERPGRQPYLKAESWQDQMHVVEVMPEQLTIEEFPGYKAVHVSKSQLDSIIDRRVASWHAALSNVGGVYLVTDDETGKLYVGSATGAGGFWQRWSEYSASGHAGNVELKALMCDGSPERYGALRFSILEIADLATQPVEVIARESHWKRVLMAREHGLCAN